MYPSCWLADLGLLGFIGYLVMLISVFNNDSELFDQKSTFGQRGQRYDQQPS